MKSIKIISLLIIVFLFFSCNKKESEEEKHCNNKKGDYYVAAYVWPSYHHDERFGDMIWPEGTGEWEVIKKGNPRFDGHYQPKLPLWGYEMDNDPKVIEKWIDVATDHGVNVFIYDWYWYDGGPMLESAINDGFLKAKNNEKMQFYLMWANHDFIPSVWNVHKFDENTPRLPGSVDWENFKIIVDRVITKYFKQPNYFKIDGQPVFSIWDINKLIEGFDGSIEETKKALQYFREKVKEAGFPDLHIQWNQGGGQIMSEEELARFSKIIEDFGYNSVATYNMGGLKGEDYLVYGSNSLKMRSQLDSFLKVPLFPCVSVGWDDSPRFPAYGKKDVIHYHHTPESFATLLYKAKEYVDSHPDQPKLITINAWNEWVEGSYLLPDMHNGFGFLEAVKDVFTDDKYGRY